MEETRDPAGAEASAAPAAAAAAVSPAPPVCQQRFKVSRYDDSCALSHECIAQAVFFAGLDKAFLQHFTAYLQLEMFVQGQEIIRERDEGDKMYFLYRGSVDVLVGPDSKKVATLSSGSVFGEMALFGVAKRTATIQASEFCDCRVIDFHLFHLILEKFPKERSFFRAMAKDRLAKLQETRAQTWLPTVPPHRNSAPCPIPRHSRLLQPRRGSRARGSCPPLHLGDEVRGLVGTQHEDRGCVEFGLAVDTIGGCEEALRSTRCSTSCSSVDYLSDDSPASVDYLSDDSPVRSCRASTAGALPQIMAPKPTARIARSVDHSPAARTARSVDHPSPRSVVDRMREGNAELRARIDNLQSGDAVDFARGPVGGFTGSAGALSVPLHDRTPRQRCLSARGVPRDPTQFSRAIDRRDRWVSRPPRSR